MVARKTSKAPTRIWSFNALRPLDYDSAHEIHFKQGRYYNKLVELERERRRSWSAVRESVIPGMTEVEQGLERVNAEIEALLAQIKAARKAPVAQAVAETGKKKGKSRAVPLEMSSKLDEFKAHRKALSDRRRELSTKFKEIVDPAATEYKRRCKERGEGKGPPVRARVNAETFQKMLGEDWPEPWKRIAKIDSDHLLATKRARAESGLAHGCYTAVEEAVQSAIEKSRPTPPKFKRFRGEGKIRTQLTDKNTFADVVAGRCPRLRLEQALAKGKGKRSNEFFTLHLRVNKTSWVSAPVRLHRLPTDDTSVKWAWILTKRIGERLEHKFQLTLEGYGLARERPAGAGEIEVKFCSRVGSDGSVVVGEWCNRETGEVGAIRLSQEMRERLDYWTVLRSHADDHYGMVRDVLSKWTKLGGNNITRWLPPSNKKAQTKHGVSNLEGQRMLLRHHCEAWARHELGGDEGVKQLWVRWRDWRKSQGNDLFAYLHVATRWGREQGLSGRAALAFWCHLWACKDRHLRHWSAVQRRRAENQRDAVFRREAIRLATQFETCVCDSANLAEQKRKPKVEETENAFQGVRTLRQNAAPGRLREIVLEVFGHRGSRERLGDDENPGASREGKKDQGSESVTGLNDAAE